MVCKKFGKLPNDPLVAGLTDFQMEWITQNLLNEQAAAKKLAGAGSVNVTDAAGVSALGV